MPALLEPPIRKRARPSFAAELAPPMPPMRTVWRAQTLEEFEQIPEGVKAELIDGVIYIMTTPIPRHARLINKLYFQLQLFLQGKKYEVFPGNLEIKLGDNIFVPDIMVTADPSGFDRRRYNAAPVFIVEVLSPSTEKIDAIRKRAAYGEAGVREYWIVDGDAPTVTVCLFAEGKEISVAEYAGGKIASAALDGLTIDLAEVFNPPWENE
ncbi:MAG: Uma2 family endonuclease [Planctomycetota bacterium]|nr:Uma2 family endonuclease [Planctomycetota bacterium]